MHHRVSAGGSAVSVASLCLVPDAEAKEMHHTAEARPPWLVSAVKGPTAQALLLPFDLSVME